MKRLPGFILIAFIGIASWAAAQDASPLKLIKTIPLPGIKDGDFDHFSPEAGGTRLFLTAEKNGSVLVLDTGTNKLLHTIAGLKEPHAILYRSDLERMFVVDGGASAIKMYDGKTYRPLGRIPLSIDADSMTYDPKTKYLYVVNGGREAKTPFSFISVVDTTSAKKLRDIKIDSNWVEALALEESGPRLFFNITGKNAVGVLDRTTGSVVATWPVPGKLNVALALDQANRRLFIVTRDPSSLIVLDSDTGKVITTLPSAGLVDDITYDSSQKRIYLAGDQSIDIFDQQDPDHYKLLAKVAGGFRAKTAILLPQLKRYYLAVPHHGSNDAEVRVYEVQ